MEDGVEYSCSTGVISISILGLTKKGKKRKLGVPSPCEVIHEDVLHSGSS
jgi:hypothetical protein